MRFALLIALFAVACTGGDGDKVFDVVEMARIDCRIQYERAVAWLERNPVSLSVGADADRSIDKIERLIARMKAECPLTDDPWRKPYYYGRRDRPADDKSLLLKGVLTVGSCGPDGEPGTYDDLRYPAAESEDEK